MGTYNIINLVNHVDFSGMDIDKIKGIFSEIPDDMEFVNIAEKLTFIQKIEIIRKHMSYNSFEILSRYQHMILLRLISKDSNNMAEAIARSCKDLDNPINKEVE